MSVHKPVLYNEVLTHVLPPFLNSTEPGYFIDFTFGGGGHTLCLLEEFEKKNLNHRVIAFDRDFNSIKEGTSKFQRWISAGQLTLHHRASSMAPEKISGLNILGMLADVGLSSDQLDKDQRGFSFLKDGPLDMRMDTSQGKTAYEILNEYSEDHLARIIKNFGEDRFANRIASAIVRARRDGQIPNSTKALSGIVVSAYPKSARHGRIHVATRTFQALRIETNDEMGELDQILVTMLSFLKRGSRAGVISFHSLEDRKVKNSFKMAKESKKGGDAIQKTYDSYRGRKPSEPTGKVS